MAGVEMGFTDAYVAGRIEVDGDLADLVATAIQNVNLARNGFAGKVIEVASKVSKRRSLRKQKEDIASHYDLGNEFFKLFLDPTMTYSCAYFATPDDSIEEAQRHKVDHSLRKLRLKPGETLLDIGSGWGAAIIRAAERYGASCTGITLSEEQYEGSRAVIRERGLEDRVQVRLVNYLELAKEAWQFDKVLSIGMIEHVGKAHLGQFAAAVASMLKPEGLALLHHITSPGAAPSDPSEPEGFRGRIFPGTYLPTLGEMTSYLAQYGMRVLGVENLRQHYRLTLDRWSEAYEANVAAVREKYGEEFVRFWRLYLRGGSACFRTGSREVQQILASKGVTNRVPLTMADVYA
jgi:cyclopropane-fatty-acyl-phospholipid synthase